MNRRQALTHLLSSLRLFCKSLELNDPDDHFDVDDARLELAVTDVLTTLADPAFDSQLREPLAVCWSIARLRPFPPKGSLTTGFRYPHAQMALVVLEKLLERLGFTRITGVKPYLEGLDRFAEQLHRKSPGILALEAWARQHFRRKA